jgi:hypothetical protein
LRLTCWWGEARRQARVPLGTLLALGVVVAGTARAAEIALLLFVPDVDAGVVVAPHGIAVEAGRAVDASGTGAAQSGVDEDLGEGTNAELAFGLEGDGVPGPGHGVGERGQNSDHRVIQSSVA